MSDALFEAIAVSTPVGQLNVVCPPSVVEVIVIDEVVVVGMHEAGAFRSPANRICFTIWFKAKAPFCFTVVTTSDLLLPRKDIKSIDKITPPTVTNIDKTTKSSIRVYP
jgi:hypothetical protein